jgi:hypothetical protein
MELLVEVAVEEAKVEPHLEAPEPLDKGIQAVDSVML